MVRPASSNTLFAVLMMRLFWCCSSFSAVTRGTMISGITSKPLASTSSAASRMADTCISVSSGYTMPRRQPRWPSIGLHSSRSARIAFSSSSDMSSTGTSAASSSSGWGMNSWRGGSRRRMLTGRPFIASKMPTKSSFWYFLSREMAETRAVLSLEKNMRRTSVRRCSSKNMCSVRQRPMPSQPNARPTAASTGVSALARTVMVRYLSASSMRTL
mmetsp:Transcript_24850/g.42862  ORF Transcript_24850/g.42862 Transcript_24850/m.42862 type:complete len:215 (-) Transcript_24850:1996-2640(-)